MAAQKAGGLSLIATFGRLMAKTLAWLLLACGLFYAAATMGGLIGTNSQWREPESGVEIFVETNGVHTAIIVPRVHEAHDWADFLPPSDLSDPSRQGRYLSFSWGERTFYLETERWEDVKLGPLLGAAFGSDETLMHIYHYQRISDGPFSRSVIISEEQYAQLIELLKAKFALIDSERPEPIAGYGQTDLFYPAMGSYSLLYSCNNWTSDTLSKIGVTAGLWTPMENGVMRWFPEEGE
ncbi:TIGR02117 family protein [Alterisphingorhabdus coralli]|uniref:TIGR02117 family protein n=1 Tax=Alterisphingorhabdus coralli TaxID=3071408 RepID=A0AA97F999_9SPHN|nr:TIGR02117 family protein [Parasphingorhabdus sp. SCSIO 66989]WOE76496.1 TIGR02117 family protein [Parasphingorhabdus sp. SCSIO 66989]